ncbi:hypothetical protein [Yoonia sp. BS5-3]|uniref:Thioredoxin domain-containing protein n=1 Tax=Yoonia phaeophyticola TaxID=3137369 RepID=A0ABZ2V8R5_9RHOB
MKKQRKRHQPKKKPHAAQAEAGPAKAPNRRALLRNGLIGAAVLGVAGFLTASTVMATISEHDLSRVGQGVPMVVQVHDPQCPSCRDLQRETRTALEAFDESELQYVIASLTSTTGAAFAAQYAAPRITLLLFDGAGNLQETINGVHPYTDLQLRFSQLVALDR